MSRRHRHVYPPTLEPPAWFLKELALIDPEVYLVWNPEFRYWQFMKDLKIIQFANDGRARHIVEAHCRAVETHLDERALAPLRYRRWLGQRYLRDLPEGVYTAEYLRWIKAEESAAKKKAEELAIDQMTAGFMKMHRLATTRTYS